MTTTPIGWPEAQRICDIPEVREALDKFAADAHEENMLAMVSAIMGHAFTQGRAAGLEEAARMVEDYQEESAPVHFSVVASDIRALSSLPSEEAQGKAANAQDEQDRETGRKWREDSSLETWFPFTAKELLSTRKLFAAACSDLGYISEELGLDPDDGGAEPILDAIRELKTGAARYQWLRDKAMFGTRHDPAVLKDGPSDCCEFAFGEELDALVDAALSSLEVIGKGEKG